ncbi:GMC family oxidoreductase [Pseudomonas cremoricolorata]|uniref:GMC family oxidoreductase n=1 Tax=Pseudomonas cremoricolorata TaxID=157783 RepID=UPI00041B7932|nr:GMC family oxidoreductase [Pseudomonas cremoricolorata]
MTTQAKKLPGTDVVVVGLGWAGSIVAKELADAGLRVIGFERGAWRDTASDFNIASAADELRYVQRQELMLRTRQNTCTLRNNVTQTALPMRTWGSFHPGNGTGGAGNHWAGITFRFQPDEFHLKSHLEDRYGKQALEGLSVQDWGTTWEEMEPFYDAFERVAGISGKAGNIGGTLIEGGNPFEGPRRRDYPNPPTQQTFAPTLFAEAARNLGYKPFPVPSALASQGYTNSYGVTMGPCTFCGFCTNYGCANYSKASAIVNVLPALIRMPNFTAKTHCEVLEVRKDSSGKRATGIVYVDANGQTWEQPAEIVVVAAFTFENVRLMLLSGIGEPYDPVSNTGTTGRNYAYQTANNVQLFFDEGKNFNPFIGGGAIGMGIDEFNNDNFDHSGLGFVGGGSTRVTPIGAAPIASRPVPPGTPRWGSQWKKTTAQYYSASMSIGCEASNYSSRTNYLSLDPTYKDPHGRPLLRITFDFTENDLRMAQYVTGKTAEIARALNPSLVVESPRKAPWNNTSYQSSHVVGGFVMGADPATSSVNKHLQVWDVPNLFVVGASAFPQNPGYNPTGTVGALAFKAAHAIRTLYLKRPGEMISV